MSYIIALFVFLLAIFTCGLMMATFKLVDTTKKLAMTAEGTSKRQLRAYVHVSNVEKTADTPHATNFRIVIRNVGQTPAYDVITQLWVSPISEYAKRWPVGEWPKIDTNGAGRSIIAPGVDTVSYVSVNRISYPEMMQLRTGTRAIFVYGIIIYKDIFGIERNTKFSFRYSKKGGEASNVNISDQLVMCEEGNIAT